MIEKITLALILPIFSIGFLHYFNWYGLLNRKLYKLELIILAIMTITISNLAIFNIQEVIYGIQIIIISIVSELFYTLIDKYIEYRWRAKEAEEREKNYEQKKSIERT